MATLAERVSRGGEVELDPGVHYLTNASIRRSIDIISSDPKQPAIIMMSAAHPSAPMLKGSGIRGIHFENVVIDGNFKNQRGQVRGQSAQVLTLLRNCSDISQTKCTIRNSASDGLKMYGCSDVLIEDNSVKDLGHEYIYALNNTHGVTIRDNDVMTRTNSAFRISSGGTGYEINSNYIHSWLDRASTGPGIEIDKGNISDIEIWDNTFETLNGAGVWLPSNGGRGRNIHIHDNVFDNVGQYYTTSGKYEDRYNGYSCGAITGAGFDGVLIEYNTFKNLKHVICLNEWKYNSGGNFTWHFNNNIVEGSDVGFRIDLSKGHIVGAGNKLTKVKKFAHGFTNNIKLSTSTIPETPKPTEPVPNMSGEIEEVKAVITVTDGKGRTGTQTLILQGTKEKPSTLEKVTLRLSQYGIVGNRTYSLPATTNSQPSGSDWLVKLALTRGAITDNHSFILPGIAGTGVNELKYRAKDGLYCESPLNIIMSEAPEPVVEPEPIVPPKNIKLVHTVKLLENGIVIFEKEIVDEVGLKLS